MAESDNQNTNSNDLGKDSETSLKERELALKEKEIEAKIKLDKQGLWFTSPLFIGVITALSGLIGTGIGAILQGNATVNLERLKFEFTLIQKALEAPTEEEAAKRLIFLINSGVIISLDDKKLKKVAEKPIDIPIYSQPQSSEPVTPLPPYTGTSLEVFFDSYQSYFGPLKAEEKSELTRVINFIQKDKDMKDIGQIAYFLASIKHETAYSYRPRTEVGNDSYFGKYDAGTSIGKRLGNTETGDGPKFKGRGYVQIVGRAYYQKFNEIMQLVNTDNDLVKYPEKMLDPQISYRITSYGMKNGTFTGKKLDDYISANKRDYKNARRIINGLDQCDLIKSYAEKFEIILLNSLTSNSAN